MLSKGKSRSLLFPTLALGFCIFVSSWGFASNEPDDPCWIGTWASSPQLAEAKDIPPELNGSSVTIRQVVHVSAGGSKIRVRFSNAFGTASLHLAKAHVAISAGNGSVRIESDRELTFHGRTAVSIPAGALVISDALDFQLPALSDLAITAYFKDLPSTVTAHPGSRTTSYILPGDAVAAPSMSQATKVDHWYYINGLDVLSQSCRGSVAILGDSITDGAGSTTNANDRWPDELSRLLDANSDTQGIGALNHGIGGNRLLRDGLGPNALARFDRDVLAQTGIRWLIVLEGTNDLGTRLDVKKKNEGWATVEDMIASYEQIIARAHTHGIRVMGATLTPFCGSSYSSADTEADRQKINHWILTGGAFDSVVDFDKIVRDPNAPDRLLPAFDSGDHLHLSPAGYAAMAHAVPLSWFLQGRTTPRLKLAITFDDLPAHGPLPPGRTRIEVASKIIAALRAANSPPSYGFVNGLRVDEQPGDAEVLRTWRAAGNLLANHAWSHMNLNQHSAEEFEKDVIRNEPLLVREMGQDDWHWLRYPYLATGDTVEKRAAVREFLSAHGYRIAAVTMTFADYLWNEPYARCSAAGNSEAISAMRAAFLAAADENINWYRSLSHQLYGRDIPYVLLMHIGAFDAEMLPDLLRLYQSRGFEFVTLPEAEADKFYVADETPRVDGPDGLEAAMNEHHLTLPERPTLSLDLNHLCR